LAANKEALEETEEGCVTKEGGPWLPEVLDEAEDDAKKGLAGGGDEVNPPVVPNEEALVAGETMAFVPKEGRPWLYWEAENPRPKLKEGFAEVVVAELRAEAPKARPGVAVDGLELLGVVEAAVATEMEETGLLVGFPEVAVEVNDGVDGVTVEVWADDSPSLGGFGPV
jgi:hypothetical protein